MISQQFTQHSAHYSVNDSMKHNPACQRQFLTSVTMWIFTVVYEHWNRLSASYMADNRVGMLGNVACQVWSQCCA